MMDNATKRAPHCFNFLRQFRILSKSGAGNFDQQSKVPGLCPNALHYYFVFFDLAMISHIMMITVLIMIQYFQINILCS